MPLLMGWCEKNCRQGLFPGVCLKRRMRCVCRSEATTCLLWQASCTSPSPHVCHRAAQPHADGPDWEALWELSSSPWERARLPPWEETQDITCHFKFLTANPLSFSHSGNCRVKSRREQLDMWMGGGGCSSPVCPASTVSDWLDWLSYLVLGRFKISQSDCCAWLDEMNLAGISVRVWQWLQLPWSVLLSPPSLTQSDRSLPAAGLHSPRCCVPGFPDAPL